MSESEDFTFCRHRDPVVPEGLEQPPKAREKQRQSPCQKISSVKRRDTMTESNLGKINVAKVLSGCTHPCPNCHGSSVMLFAEPRCEWHACDRCRIRWAGGYDCNNAWEFYSEQDFERDGATLQRYTPIEYVQRPEGHLKIFG
jgi:hypothetical protein